MSGVIVGSICGIPHVEAIDYSPRVEELALTGFLRCPGKYVVRGRGHDGWGGIVQVGRLWLLRKLAEHAEARLPLYQAGGNDFLFSTDGELYDRERGRSDR